MKFSCFTSFKDDIKTLTNGFVGFHQCCFATHELDNVMLGLNIVVY